MKLKERIKNTWEKFTHEKISPMLVVLIVISTTAMLIANIIAAKTFPLFTAGDLTVLLPCAVIIFPVTYICSDVFSEVYGYKWSRRTAWLSFFMNLLMVTAFEIAIIMPGTTDLSVLHSTWFLLIASLIAYMVGDFVNDIIFKKMKVKRGEKGFVWRAALSSLGGEFCDSLIYIPLAMGLLPMAFAGGSFMSWPQIALCVVFQPLMKFAFEFVISPLTYWLTRTLKKMEASRGFTYDI